MASNYLKIYKGINIAPLASAVSAKGDIGYNSATDKLELYNGATDPFVNEAKGATLTNKTMSGASNTFSSIGYSSLVLTTSIVNGDISASAAIAYSKLALTDSIVNADINSAAGIVDTKLATIATALKVSNSATTAASANTASAIVARDGSGDFTAGTITAALTGTASGNTTYTANNHGVVLSSATNAMTVVAPNASTAFALISGGASADPSWAKLTEAGGGTNQTAYTTGDILYASATNTLSKLPVGTANQGLSVVDGLPAWATLNQGGINYIASNPNAEVGTTGWATYADAAGTTPVNGTGGAATETWTRSTSSPLRGTGSFLLTKDAANRQGEGASYDFTLDSADQAKPIMVSFDYTIGSGTYADADLTVYLYDITNSLVIQPAPYTILSVTAGLSQKWIGYFQTSAASTSYRLIIHTASVSPSAYTVKFDNFNVGPTYQSYGAVATDWVAWTPTGSWNSGGTWTGYKRRVGDTAEYKVRFAASGGVTVATLTVNLPTGEVIDTAKITASSIETPLGYGEGFDTSASREYPISVYYSSTTAVQLRTTGSDEVVTYQGTGTIVNATTPVTWANGDSIDLSFSVPISGWSSNVQVSSDADTRVCSSRATLTTTQSGVTDKVVPFNNVTTDTHGAFNSTTGVWTCPTPGLYEVRSQVVISSSGSPNDDSVTIQKNGATYSQSYNNTLSATTTQTCGQISDIVSCVAGDTIGIFIDGDASFTIDSGGNRTWVAISRISGPSQIAASEKVYAFYGGNAGTALTANVTNIDYSTKVQDSHNAFSGATFTAPRAGYYLFSGSAFTTAGVTATLSWYVNTTIKQALGSGTSARVFDFSFGYYLNAGDAVTLRSDTNATLSNSATLHWISIASQG